MAFRKEKGVLFIEVSPFQEVKGTLTVFFRKNFQGGKPMFREIEGGRGLELHVKLFKRKLAKAQGDKTIFRGGGGGGKKLPLKPALPVLVYAAVPCFSK